MDIEKLEHLINIISKGDIRAAEILFNKPGGRKFLESLVLVIISNSLYERQQKEDLFKAFLLGMNKIEKRLKHQREGQNLLNEIFN